MESSSSIRITTSDKFTRLQTTNYAFHPSIVNGIQRTMLNFLKSYMFDMYLDAEDYEFLTLNLKIPRINPKHQKFTTLSCNTKFPIPMLSLHMSRQAINSEVLKKGENGGANVLLCNNLRKVYFALCAPRSEEADPIARISKPLTNGGAAPVIVYARDLEPFVFTRESERDPWTYNQEESYELTQRIDEVFVYNGKMALIEHGKHVNTILKPRLVNGKEDPAGNPCRSSYRWVMNPVFKDTHPIVNDDFTLRRKIEGQPGAKDMFLMAPTEDEGVYGKMNYQNKFGKPYGLDLMFQYNGKWTPLRAMKEAINSFILSLNLLSQELTRTGSDIIHKENGNEGWSTQVTIPLNVDANLAEREGGKYQVLLDDGLHHAVSVKVLELLDKVIGERLSLWENTAVYYKVPHRLISQIILFVKTPESPEFDQEVRDSLPASIVTVGKSTSELLIHAAIAEVISDLNTISAAMEAGNLGSP